MEYITYETKAIPLGITMPNTLSKQKLDCSIEPVDSSTYKTSAKRPINGKLACEKLTDVLGFNLKNWKTEITDYMELNK